MKPNAGALLRKWLRRKSWVCQPINLSGVTDPYQPIEKKLRLTRDCLQVAIEHNQPIYIITKNALVARDLDLLTELKQKNLVHVIMTVTSLDQSLTRILEPRTSSPTARLQAIAKLTENEIPVRVNIAPIIVGLNEHEVPEVLKQAAAAGAVTASYTVLRLPGAVESVFLDWVKQHFPDRLEKIENGIRQMSGGELINREFFDRMRGTGVLADHVRNTFKTFANKYGLNKVRTQLSVDHFRVPLRVSKGDPRQRTLFDDA